MPITHETLARLIVREQDKLKAYAWAIVRDAHAVGEVLQEVALLATRKLDQIRDEAHFPAWARVACRHLALKAVEGRRRRPVTLSNDVLDLLDPEWGAYDDADAFCLTDLLRDCVGGLGDRDRRVVELRYAAGLTTARVAEQLGEKVTTLYVTLSRIHRRLGDCVRRKRATLEAGRG